MRLALILTIALIPAATAGADELAYQCEAAAQAVEIGAADGNQLADPIDGLEKARNDTTVASFMAGRPNDDDTLERWLVWAYMRGYSIGSLEHAPELASAQTFVDCMTEK